MVWLVVTLTLVVSLPGTLALGTELGGWLDTTISLLPATSELDWDSTLYLGVDFADALSGSLMARLESTSLDRLTLQGSWYERPLRLTGSCEFKEGAFYKAKGEFRYWESPWQVKVKGELRSGEPASLSLMGEYDDDLLEANLDAVWEEPTLSELDVSLKLPALADWSLELSFRYKEQTPTLTCRASGPTPWGKLTLDWQEGFLSRLRLYRELAWGDWQHELDFDWELPGDPELAVASVLHLDERSGWGLDLKVSGLAPIVLTRLRPYSFGPTWKVTLDPLEQEIALRAAKEVGEAELGCDLSWGEEGLEGELWLDFYLGEVELIGGLYWEEGAVAELSLELYLEF